MPTREGADLVPVRAATKERLRALKGEATFDEAILRLLEATEVVPLERPRLPDEQIALADMAARRWRIAMERGRIIERGPRLISFVTGKQERSKLRVRQA